MGLPVGHLAGSQTPPSAGHTAHRATMVDPAMLPEEMVQQLADSADDIDVEVRG